MLAGAAALTIGDARAAGSFDDGHRLAAFLDSLQVESRWPAGVHVNWQTGLPDGKTEQFEGKHTHCSAFVASAAKQLGVYILRPPDHGQMLLANAQYDWLAAEGATNGWTPAADGFSAQQAANRGFLVVAAYKNHDDDRPGHIADRDGRLTAAATRSSPTVRRSSWPASTTTKPPRQSTASPTTRQPSRATRSATISTI